MSFVATDTGISIPWSHYIPQKPTVPQLTYLMLDHREALYGGAAGGGKSSCGLMGALQYMDYPDYAALIIRRDFGQLNMTGALQARAHEWLDDTDAQWSAKDKRWTFPSGASLTFGYLRHFKDVGRYKSAEFQYIFFDELTEFEKREYIFMNSRIRRRKGSPIPLRLRAASNPGGPGHVWTLERFIKCQCNNVVTEEDLAMKRCRDCNLPFHDPNDKASRDRMFVPAKLQDNPYIDQEEYIRSLSHLDPITRRQLMEGDWAARKTSGKFDRDWMEIVDSAPGNCRFVRAWDWAATEKKGRGNPDWTVGVLLGYHPDGYFYICDVIRFRGTPKKVEDIVRATAISDGQNVEQVLEEEPGASGKHMVSHYARNVLQGFSIVAVRHSGSKEMRFNAFSSQCEHRNVKVVRGSWNSVYFDELESYTGDADEHEFDDQSDATSTGFNELVNKIRGFDVSKLSGMLDRRPKKRRRP